MKPSQYLLQPYPFYYRGKALFRISLGIFLFGFLFYYLLEPFSPNKDEHKMAFFWISLVHALVPAMIMFLMGAVRWSFPHVEDHWNLKSEFLFLIIFLVLAGVGQYLIRDLIYYKPDNWDLQFLFEEVRNTLIIGVIFVTLLTLINFNRLYQTNWQRAKDVAENIDNKYPHMVDEIVSIKTEVKSDDFELAIHHFLFARAFGNYMEIFIADQGEVKKYLKRIATNQLETQLNPFDFILKTHRSYLLNLRQVTTVQGNAQGYQLELKNCDEKVPVSRGLISIFDSKIKNLKKI